MALPAGLRSSPDVLWEDYGKGAYLGFGKFNENSRVGFQVPPPPKS